MGLYEERSVGFIRTGVICGEESGLHEDWGYMRCGKWVI
jgi:hypothetical protein